MGYTMKITLTLTNQTQTPQLQIVVEGATLTADSVLSQPSERQLEAAYDAAQAAERRAETAERMLAGARDEVLQLREQLSTQHPSEHSQNERQGIEFGKKSRRERTHAERSAAAVAANRNRRPSGKLLYEEIGESMVARMDSHHEYSFSQLVDLVPEHHVGEGAAAVSIRKWLLQHPEVDHSSEGEARKRYTFWLKPTSSPADPDDRAFQTLQLANEMFRDKYGVDYNEIPERSAKRQEALEYWQYCLGEARKELA